MDAAGGMGPIAAAAEVVLTVGSSGKTCKVGLMVWGWNRLQREGGEKAVP